jgi:hypothetical protein
VDWWNVVEIAAGVVAGGMINWYFSRRSSAELRNEAETLRQLTLKLTHILAGAGVIEVKEWDPETGEPKKWPVVTSRKVRYNVEAPTPRLKRVWQRWFGG